MHTWKITIGINHYYLTTEEKEFYLKSINAGQQYVQLKSGKVLSKNFMDLVPTVSEDENKKVENGMWQCDYQSWHYKGSECSCEKYGKELPAPKSVKQIMDVRERQGEEYLDGGY